MYPEPYVPLHSFFDRHHINWMRIAISELVVDGIYQLELKS